MNTDAEVQAAADRVIDAAMRPEIEEAITNHLASIRKARAEGRDILAERLSEKMDELLEQRRDAG